MPSPRTVPIPALLAALARALAGGRRVRMGYVDAEGEATERDVDVLGLAFRDGPWLVAAWCHRRDAFRLFRADRITRARLLREPASGRAPPGFDARFFSASAWLEPGDEAALATVRLRRPLDAAAAALFPAALQERCAEAAVLCHLRASALPALAGLVHSLGPGADLLRPPAARSALAALRGR